MEHMSHSDFVKAYAAGGITVDIVPQDAARFLSARLLLPFVILPILGTGVALALIGWIWSGLAVIGLALAARWLIKRSAPHFVLTQSLADAQFYLAATQQQVLRIRTGHDGDAAGGNSPSVSG
jgi:hypothetical protein